MQSWRRVGERFDLPPNELHQPVTMAMDPKRFVGLAFVLAAVLSEAAAILPLVRGRPLNVVFLGVGVVFLILGLAKLRGAKPSPD